jgi:hypothetical protein
VHFSCGILSTPATAEEDVVLIVGLLSFTLKNDSRGEWQAFDETAGLLNDFATGERRLLRGREHRSREDMGW